MMGIDRDAGSDSGGCDGDVDYQLIGDLFVVYLEDGADVSHREPASSADDGWAAPMGEDCLRRS